MDLNIINQLKYKRTYDKGFCYGSYFSEIPNAYHLYFFLLVLPFSQILKLNIK